MKKKLHIIISNYDDIHNPYYSGGGAHAMHEIGKRLAKKHAVTIISGKYTGAVDTVIDGVEYVHTGTSSGGPLFGQIVYACSLPFYIRKWKFDVWFENFIPPHSTNMLQLFTKKPVIGITSLLDAHKFSEKYHLPFAFIERIGLTTYKYIIALSPAMKQRILAHNANCEIRIIPDGIASSLLKLPKKEKNYVFFLGRLDIFQKGLDTLLDAWKEVKKKYPSTQLILAGDGTMHDKEKLKAQVETAKLDDVVVFTGRIDGKQKNTLISESTAAIFPSRFESFGIAPLEALAAGKPMICFDIEGFSWIDPSVCLKVPTHDSDQLATAIIHILAQKKLRTTLSLKARTFAKPYTWDVIAKEYETFAQSVSQ